MKPAREKRSALLEGPHSRTLVHFSPKLKEKERPRLGALQRGQSEQSAGIAAAWNR